MATLAVAIGLIFTSIPAQAQAERQTLQLQRADGSTAPGLGTPWTPSGVDNLSYRNGDQVTITHSASQEIIAPTGISCPTPPNSWFRVFDLSEFEEVTSGLDVTSVEVGVESVGTPGTTTVNLYSLDGPFVTANLSLVGTTTVDISSADDLSILTVPITGGFGPTDVIVVEWHVPQAGVFFGGNELGQTSPTYIQAEACGASEPTDLATLGEFPDNAWVVNVTGTLTDLVTIAEARAMGPDATVTVQGTVTRAKGAFTYFQDATAGLTIRQTSGDFFDDVADGTITSGTRIRATGTLSEFASLLQINEGDLDSYEILSDGDAPAAQSVTLQELVDNGEDYEAELVRVTGLTIDGMGTFEAATSYTVTDPTESDTLRVPNAEDSDIDGTEIPEATFAFEGVVGQFSFDGPDLGYQLLAIEESDIIAGAVVDEAIHDTGEVQFEVYSNGSIGTEPPDWLGTGFVFEGDAGLFTGSFVVGASESQVSGNYYGAGTGTFEWSEVQGLVEYTPPFESPFESFDQSYEAVYDDSAAPNPIGLEVTQRSYSSTEEEHSGFTIMEFTIENTSGGDLTGLYPGVFADWDVSAAYEQNLGGFNEATNLLYAWDNTGAWSSHFGVAALGDATVSGTTYDALGSAETDSDIYSYLTTLNPEPVTPADRRMTLGVGPIDLAAGESATIRFAVVGGSDEADIIENAFAAQALFAEPIDQAVHDTGPVQFEVFADGDLGTDAPDFEGTGFVFEGDNGLFTSQFVVGASESQVSGVYYGEGEWITTEPLAMAGPPAGYTQAFSAGFDDSGADDPIGVEVEQLSYSATDDDYVIVRYAVTNTTANALEDLYLGVFADWDVGEFAQNLGGYDEETQLLYIYDDSGVSTNYFGVAAIGDVPVSGVSYNAVGGTETDEDIYGFLTTIAPDPTGADDRRATLGVGPYSIAAGEEIEVEFAFVGGESLADIIENANAAQGNPVATEQTTQAGTFALHSAYPNPFATTTTLGFSLPTTGHVRLTVYDVLGRRVATLIDDVQQAGEQSVVFDASSLGSGTYFYRLEAGGTQLTERFTVVR